MSPPQNRNCAARTGRGAFAGQFAPVRHAVKQNALAKRNFTFVNMAWCSAAVFAVKKQVTIMRQIVARVSEATRGYRRQKSPRISLRSSGLRDFRVDHDERAHQPAWPRREISFSQGDKWKAVIRMYIGAIPPSGEAVCIAEQTTSGGPLP